MLVFHEECTDAECFTEEMHRIQLVREDARRFYRKERQRTIYQKPDILDVGSIKLEILTVVFDGRSMQAEPR